MAAVPYEGMTRYVNDQVEPLWDHINEHDRWHRARLEDEVKGARDAAHAALRSLLAAILGVTGIIVSIVMPLVLRG